MQTNWKTYAAIAILLAIPPAAWMAARVCYTIQFDRKCAGHLKRAADANTIALAIAEMETALAYIDAHGLNTGYTSVAYTTPDEDIGYWSKNLHESLAKLRSISPDAPSLETSNVLLKLRETLLDHSQSGENVTAPPGISVYPNNVAFAFWGFLGLLCGVGAAVFGLVAVGSYTEACD